MCGSCVSSIQGELLAVISSELLLIYYFGSMFLSRTVAAEICMEARTNEAAYSALKKLNESGDLLFELSCVAASSFSW